MNHDFISRSALLEKAKPIYIEHDNVALTHRVVSTLDIYLAPDADVVPMDYHERCLELEVKKRVEAESAAKNAKRRGHWVPTATEGRWIGIPEGAMLHMPVCSECGWRFGLIGYSFLFCPMCGAHMDEETPEEGDKDATD